ncbi:SLC13 family permease [bacterium]|nr:SLC13 family permease [bacterium]
MTYEIASTLFILIATIALFVSEKLRVDVVAIIVMIALPWFGLVTPSETFSGLSSNAVISIMAVMILGYGVDKSGVMNHLTKPILTIAGKNQKRLIAVIGGAVGILSAFIQNIGATALFLPAVLKIANQVKISPSRLLMPIGFSAILGGTLTLFGSGPLIILNDLLAKSGAKTFGIFDVTPIGVALLSAGIIYFLLLGKFVLPQADSQQEIDDQETLIDFYQISNRYHIGKILENSKIIGKKLDSIELWDLYKLHLIILKESDDLLYAPWRHTVFSPGQVMVLSGPAEGFLRFAEDYQISILDLEKEQLAEELKRFGYAEVIIPPNSSLKGRSLKEISFRKKFGVEPIQLHNDQGAICNDFSDEKFGAGDILIIHGLWEKIWEIKNSKELIPISKLQETTHYKKKPIIALICFLGSILLAVSGFQLSHSLFTGAAAMILLGVLNIEEAYKAIDWRTVFLLGGLIPLGIAMDKSGAAQFLAEQIFSLVGDAHPIIVLISISILATVFTLFMSNVAATVLLVPLVVIMGNMLKIAPEALGLLVAVMASNSFLLPTHQVNAFLMGPGGYKNRDYLKSGGLMSILFIFITVSLIYLFYL